MPGLGLGLSISARNAITAGSSAPSGIPVASTASVIISGNATFNGTAVKKVNPQLCAGSLSTGAGQLYVYSGAVYAYGLDAYVGKILIPPQTLLTDDIAFGAPDKLNTPYSTWRLVDAAYDGDADYYIISAVNNSSTDATIIPTSGWSASITITAA
jgi:hypothetical protein